MTWRYLLRVHIILLSIFVHVGAASTPVAIPVSFKTVTTGNDVDDAAIWVHPDTPEKSVVFINDKGISLDVSGIYIYALDGKLLNRIALHNPVNPDVRNDVVFGTDTMDVLVCVDREAGNAAYNRIRVFQIHPEKTASSTDFTTEITVAAGIPSGQSEAYGHGLYLRQSDRALFSVVSSNGRADFTQIKFSRNSGGFIDGAIVRRWGKSDISGTLCEGICTDDELGYLYIADEDAAVLKYVADPDRKTDTVVHAFAQNDGISGDREGMNIYRCEDGTGYLLLSSQGNHRINVYDRVSNALVGVLAPDGMADCDGLDVTSMSLGSAFPGGMAAVHLGSTAGAQFGFYDWETISAKLKLASPCATKRKLPVSTFTDKKERPDPPPGTLFTAALHGASMYMQMPSRVNGAAQVLFFGMDGKVRMAMCVPVLHGIGNVEIPRLKLGAGVFLIAGEVNGEQFKTQIAVW